MQAQRISYDTATIDPFIIPGIGPLEKYHSTSLDPDILSQRLPSLGVTADLALSVDMESLIPQQIRTELGQILSNLVLGDNEIRRSAEKVLNDKWLANQPEILLLALAEFSRQSPDAHMRAFAAVLLRRLIFRPPLHPVPSPHPHQSFAAPKTTIYDHLSEATRENLESILLAALKEERDSGALKGVTETVCELAVGSFERKRPFPELLNVASQLANSSDPMHRESAFRIFTNVPHLLWDQNPQQVVAVLENALKSTEPVPVRHAALKACAVYLSSNDPTLQSQTVGLMFPVLVALSEFSPSDQTKALETLTSLASDLRTATLFRPHISTLTRLMEPFLNEQVPSQADPTATPTLANPGGQQFVWPPAGTVTPGADDEETLIERRYSALEFMVSLTETRPGMFRTPITPGPEGQGQSGGEILGGENSVQAAWISTLVRACLKGMGEVIEEEGNATQTDWEECEDPSATDDDYGYPQVFEGTLDRAAVALGGRALLPIAFRDIPIMLGSLQWGIRHAGLMAIAAVAEGTYQVLELEVGKVVELVVPMFADPHPRVRFAACQCIGQLCTDMQEIFQQQHTKEILSCLIPAMDAPEARVHCHAAKAIINFCCGVEADALAPYLDDIVTRLLRLLSSSPRRYVQEQALTTLAMVADASADKFQMYYPSIMPLLMQALRSPVTPETRVLHCKAMECAGLIGIAVGREAFQHDATELIKVLLQIQEQPTTDDDDTPMYLQQTWSKICQALGDVFEPYLQFVMPPLFKSASIKPDINIVDDTDEVETRDGFDVLDLDDGQHVEIRTSVLEEKSVAFDALLAHAATLGPKFGPYIRPTLELALPSLKFYFSENVREVSAMLIPTLVASGNTTGVISPDELNAIFLQVTRAIQPEGDAGFLGSLCKCLTDSLTTIGRQIIVPPLINEITGACKAQLSALASRREMRARRIKRGPEWAEDKEDMLLLQELEDAALDEMTALLTFLDPNHPRVARRARSCALMGFLHHRTMGKLSSRFAVISLGVLAQCLSALAQSDNNSEKPKTPILKYTPNKTWAIAAGSCYAFTALACIAWSLRYRGRYMLAITIGAACYAAGLFLRIPYSKDMTSVPKYAIMNLIILLSPCGFIAGVYMLLSRLAFHLNATEHLAISPRRLTKIFVTSDIITFWIQASGGGLTAGDNIKMRDVGRKLFLGGLIAQLISFLIYTYIFALFIHRVRKFHRNEWDNRPDGIMQHWLALVISMTISCALIIVRSIYRAIENGQGRSGKLATHELYFYSLDSIVLWVAISVYLITWPPRYLTNYNPGSKETIPMASATNGAKV
ncbi:Ran-binding protein 6 [Ceratobasidium theobromae]|uniref:Ran-binding protein 6 n=1 Tax=Ceratobasidium theobromae TaxID=1582974 RepID=A0A5N5QFQ9_9AGAM|nr:Ran-binding protein 6 [Ceratobasidium theobromae]